MTCTILDVMSYDRFKAFPSDITKGLSGSTVLLKPNLATSTPVSYTRPEVISALGRMFTEEGFDVVVAEGLGSWVEGFGAKVVDKTGYGMLPFKFVNLEDEPGEIVHLNTFLGPPSVTEIVVPRILMDEDVSIVNVPKLKTSLMVLFTGAIKNVAMGMVNQYTKGKIHAAAGQDFQKLSRILVEVYLALKERIPLTVVDAVESMSGNGPTHGECLHTGKILYSEDAAAMDIVLAEMMGLKDAPVPTLLQENGLAPTLSQIEVKGNLKSFPFQPPSTYRSGLAARIDSTLNSYNWLSIKLSSLTLSRSLFNLKINQSLCERCGGCLERCPSGAIRQRSETFQIDGSRCVRCLCCKELCPNDAVEITRPLSDRLMMPFYKLLSKLLAS